MLTIIFDCTKWLKETIRSVQLSEGNNYVTLQLRMIKHQYLNVFQNTEKQSYIHCKTKTK